MSRIVAAEDLAGDGGWWRSFAQVDDVAITHVDLSANASHEQAAWDWLDDSERRRWQRFLHVGARRQYVLCRASLRSLLCDALGCSNAELGFETAEHGKPFATVGGQPTPFGFNVSHSGGHGLIALTSSGRVGVDVEEFAQRRNLELLIEGVFGPNEQEELAALSGDRKLRLFFTLWTIKEALSKAHGWGLSLDVSRFEVPESLRQGEKHGTFRLSDLGDLDGLGDLGDFGGADGAWRIFSIGTEEFAAALVREAQPVGPVRESPRPSPL